MLQKENEHFFELILSELDKENISKSKTLFEENEELQELTWKFTGEIESDVCIESLILTLTKIALIYIITDFNQNTYKFYDTF